MSQVALGSFWLPFYQLRNLHGKRVPLSQWFALMSWDLVSLDIFGRIHWDQEDHLPTLHGVGKVQGI